MRLKMGMLTSAMLVPALAGSLLTSAVAEQTVPPKPSMTAPPPDATSSGDAFMPPIRGTPDGRISGGTRGLHRLPAASGTSSGQTGQSMPAVPTVGSMQDPPTPAGR